MHIQPLIDTQPGEKGRSPLPFLKIKKVSWFWKKGPDCVNFWVKFSIQNVVLSKRKNCKMFSCSISFSSVFDKTFIQVS